ncbi:MAG: oligosaccharide flippase family protein [bacterium]
MQFGQHLKKGGWGFATKLLPAIYGTVMTLLVFNDLKKSESGELALFINIFGMIFTFADSFALQAIVKFGVDKANDLQELLTATSLLFLGFLAVVLGSFIVFPGMVASLLNSKELPALIPSLVILVIVTIPRVIASKIFQMRFHTQYLFIVDCINFGGSSIIVTYYSLNGMLHGASDVIYITIATGAASSIVSLILARRDLRWRMSYSREMLKKIFHFTRYQTATGAVHVFQQNLDTLIVPAFFSMEALANYQVAKFFFKGFDVLRDTQGIFVFPASSKYHASGDFATLKKIIEKATSFLYLFMAPLCILLIIFAPTLFHFLYKGKFDDSINIFRVLIASGFILPITMVGMSALVGMGRVKEVFQTILMSLIANIILAIVLLPLVGTIGAAIAFGLSMGLQAVRAYYVMKKDVPLSLSEMFFRGISDGLNFAKRKK